MSWTRTNKSTNMGAAPDALSSEKYWRSSSRVNDRHPEEITSKYTVLDKPRPGDSIHPIRPEIDYRELFDFLDFGHTTARQGWIPIPSGAVGAKFAVPIDYVCPNCKELIHSDITGSLRCMFCGATAHPPIFRYGCGTVTEDAHEKRLGYFPDIQPPPNAIIKTYEIRVQIKHDMEYMKDKKHRADMNRFIAQVKR
jgi:hypothetical protein